MSQHYIVFSHFPHTTCHINTNLLEIIVTIWMYFQEARAWFGTQTRGWNGRSGRHVSCRTVSRTRIECRKQPRCFGKSLPLLNMYSIIKINILIQSRGTLRKRETKKILTHHMYLCMRDFGHHIGEDTEIYFSLYDARKQKYISERFLVKISKDGFSNYIDKLHSNCTMFTVSFSIFTTHLRVMVSKF